MHNGQAGGHDMIRQELDGMIPAHLYGSRLGATESEAIFLIAHGEGLDRDPIKAMARAVGQVEALSRQNGDRPYMRFAACWSDGHRLFAARYASDRHAPSLHYRKCRAGIVISSEPLDADSDEWVEVQPNTAIETTGDVIATHLFEPRVTYPRADVA